MRLGKKPARYDSRTLHMAKYLTKAALPATPVEVAWVSKVKSWPMYLNDVLGDCVPAAAGHMIEQWEIYSASGRPRPLNSQILQAYEAIGGYIPSAPATDNGCDMLTALKYWKNTGIAGHKIEAFVSINIRNFNDVRTAIWLFGNVYLGVQLPIAVQGAKSWLVPNGGVNTAQGAPGSWGGHCVPIMAASPSNLTCVTWGRTLNMSHEFLLNYADEAYAVLSADWINQKGLAPVDFNLDQLRKDLAALAA